MSRILNAVTQRFLRVFMPGIAAALHEEQQFTMTDCISTTASDTSAYMDIEDNGADTTLITFAGMAVLYAAMPKFEFKEMLRAGGGSYNFVFVRDISRCSYRLAPDGSSDGIVFYERVVSDALHRLNSTCNIALGMSGGGEAAFRISGATPIDRIIAFNPAFPLECHGSLSNIGHVALDIRKLFLNPSAYLEVLFVTLGARYLWKRCQRLTGYEAPEYPLHQYRRRAVPATLFYSKGCRPDARQALALKDVPTIRLRPIESERHNCLVEMKEKGIVASFVHEEIWKQVTEHNNESCNTALSGD